LLGVDTWPKKASHMNSAHN
jgi:hypothetical protein